MPINQTTRQHFGPAERARIKSAGEAGGDSQGAAPTHPLYMIGATRHFSILALLSAPKTNAWGLELTVCSSAPHPRPTCQQNPPRQQFRSAEGAQLKRTRETDGNSRRPAPTHPLYMPAATSHVVSFAPLSAPKTSALGRVWNSRSSAPTYSLHMPRATRPVRIFAPLSVARGKTHKGYRAGTHALLSRARQLCHPRHATSEL